MGTVTGPKNEKDDHGIFSGRHLGEWHAGKFCPREASRPSQGGIRVVWFSDKNLMREFWRVKERFRGSPGKGLWREPESGSVKAAGLPSGSPPESNGCTKLNRRFHASIAGFNAIIDSLHGNKSSDS